LLIKFYIVIDKFKVSFPPKAEPLLRSPFSLKDEGAKNEKLARVTQGLSLNGCGN